MRFHKTLLAITTAALMTQAGTTLAAISAQDAAKLGTELTPTGAERAGNADGSIPEWNGGMTTPPSDYQAGGTRIDPFADEQPLFTIDASNYQQYADKLTEGQKALFAKHADFKMPVYKTHRTFAAPQWVYDNTKTNATRTDLTADGNGVEKAFGGYPFPIPKNGKEAIWNHNLRWLGSGVEKNYANLVVYSNGEKTIGQGRLWETYPYYDQQGSLDSFNGNIFQVLVQYSLPVRRKGEVILAIDPVNQAKEPRQAWQYIPGQRRVRRAPTIAFDTPNAQFAGQATYDDSFMYNGSPERYDWKLVGKKEMFIPYNNNKMLAEAKKGIDTVADTLATPKFPNPDYMRWELHRVWVVEATLKDGSRHVYGKRTFFLDEDSWAVAATDIYDGRDNLWRAGFAGMVNAYDVPATVIRGYWHADLQNDAYAFNELDIKPLDFSAVKNDKFYTPTQVRKMSRR
ncbi:DUF1329 domain-containing protein [Motiliproteus coralliicola]|uniref:DUF1329 domain-containing protein n=1 Tax=Motiliproteus coralliicola TaxID=2283196 RepID=A0A369WRV3_9GAMM|nr:DUF1329 domain-containing protein [Motiliproteus coralliicola]RDE24387.1 DUF1329 domain-containing protein [Motiliproteus coralliicola]